MDIEIVAIIGGTGKEGKGLAHRLAKAGHQVIIGSRDILKAQLVAGELNNLHKYNFAIIGDENAQAIYASEIAILTVPYAFHATTLEVYKNILAGKILIDATVPIVPPKVTTISMPIEGSASLQAIKILGDRVTVACAFQNVSYELLMGEVKIDCDILVCCSDKVVRARIIKLVNEMGMTPRDAGSIENSIIPEGLTSILIGINKQYGIHHAGIKITGIPDNDL